MKTGYSGAAAFGFRAAILFFIAFFLHGSISIGQNVTIDQPTGQIVATCNENHFIASLVSDTFNLSINVYILKGSDTLNDPPCIRGTSNGSGDPITILIDSVKNGSFVAGPTFWTINSNPADSLTIYYRIRIDCSVLASSGSISVNMNQQWLINSAPVNLNQQSSYNVQVFTPFIQIPSNTIQDTIQYLANSDIIFPYTNTGTAGAHIKFMFEDTSNCASYIIDSLFYRVGLSSNWIDITSVSGFINNVYIPKDSTLFIRQIMRGTDCMGDCGTLGVKFKWQCNYSGASLCNECQYDYTQSFFLAKGKRSYKIQRVEPSYLKALYDTSCAGTSVDWIFEVINTSANGSALDSIIFKLNDPFYGQSSLTSINSSTVSISNTSNASLIMHQGASNDTLCQGTNTLAGFTVNIHDLSVNDTIRIYFSTLKCCWEDSLQLNKAKRFNNWQMLSYAKDECNLAPIGATSLPVFNGNLGGISSHGNDGFYDILQTLDFAPSVIDLSVAPGDTFGSYGDFYIQLKSLFHTVEDAQVMGYMGTINDTISGMLRATVKCDQGLRIDSLLKHVSIVLGLDTLPLVCAYTLVPDTICQQGEYVFYFDLKGKFSEINKFLTQGRFNFKLQACCTAVNPAEYSVEFHLLMNSNDCYNFTCGIDKYTPPACNSCCWLPLSSDGFHINVHCPGCLKPGAIVDSYNLRRTSYGFMDTDDDNIADGVATAIDSGNYINLLPLMNLNASTYGDELTDYMTAHFQDGDPSSGGYSYDQMLNDSSILHVLQLDRSINYSSTSDMDLKVNSFTLFIDVEDHINPNCIECGGFEGIVASELKTILKITVDSSDLSQYLQRNGNQYFYTFVDSIISANADTITSFTGFYHDQKYRLKTNYNACGNFTETDVYNITPTNNRKQSIIVNKMWLSGEAQNNNAWNMPGINAPNVLTANDTLNQAFADKYIFWCETFSGLHYFYGTSIFNITYYNGVTSCIKRMDVSSQVRIGYTYNNIFPYEVKYPKLTPKELVLSIPPGFQVDSGFISSSGTLFPPLPILNYQIIDTTLFLIMDSLPTINCFSDSIKNGLFATDQLNIQNLNFYLSPVVCTNDSLPKGIYARKNVLIHFTDNELNCSTGINDSLCTWLPDTIVNLASPEFMNTYKVPNPNLNINFIQNYITAGIGQVCWDYNITNYANPLSSPPTSAAPYVFLAIPDSVSMPYLNNWQVTFNNTAPVNSINNIFQLSTSINVDTDITATICASHAACDSSDTTAFNIYYGWHCFGFPTTMVDSSLCQIDSLNIGFINDSAFVLTSATQNATAISLCDTVSFTASFTVAQGSIYPQVVLLDSILQGYEPLEVLISNCNGNSNFPITKDSITGNYPITTALFDSLNITGGILGLAGSANCLNIVVNYLLDCEFLNNPSATPTIKLDWLNYCGDLFSSTSTNFIPLDIVGNNCTNCFSISKTVNTHPVYQDSLVQYSITVCNDNGSGQNVTLEDLIPAGFTVDTTNIPNGTFSLDTGCTSYFVIGHFAAINNCPNTYNTAVLTFNNGALSIADSICVDVLDGCFALADSGYIFTDTTYTKQLSSDSIDGKTVYIDGVFIVDTNFWIMNNSTVYMGIGAQIIVNEYDTLTITEGSVLQGCTTMWRGIHLEPFAGVKILSSTIRDAEIAVYASHRSGFELDAALIYDCVTGVFGPPNTGGGFVTTSGKVVRSRFAGTFNFKPHYPGQTPPLVLPKAGMELNHVIMTIGNDTSSQPNIFDKLNNGIIGRNSRLTVRNSRFNDIYDQSGLGNENGAAIVSIASQDPYGYLSVAKPTALAQDTMIYTATKGIYTDRSTTDIANVRMVNVGSGVYSLRTNNNLYANVRNCTIDAYKYGIFWILSTNANYMLASNNKINVSGNATGIYVSEKRKTVPVNYTLANNIINVNGANNGIMMLNVNRPVVKENNIRITPGTSTGTDATGIYVGGCSNPLVSCNDVASNYYPGGGSNFTKGLFVGESDTSQITCNTIDSTYQGVRFHGWNPANALRGTNFYYHFEGLYLETSAIIDKQPFHGNKWHLDTTQIPIGGYGAINWNTANGMDTSSFIVNPLGSIFTPTFPTNINSDWFKFGSLDNFSCTGTSGSTVYQYPYCHSYDTENVFEGSFDLKLAIALDMLETVDWNEESQSKARQYLYDMLMQDSVLLNSETVFLDFVAEYEGYLQAVYEVNDGLRNIEQYDSLFISMIYDADSLIQYYSDSILVIYSEGREEELAQTIEDFYYQINFLEQTKGNLISQRQALVEGELGELIHNYVVSPELPATNNQYLELVYSDFLDSGENENVIITEYNNLLVIANQCPAAGGQGVYRARAMLALINDSLHYNDAIVCLQSGIYKESLSESAIFNFSIIPNPAQDLIDVVIEKTTKEICKVLILNILGQEKINNIIDCNKLSNTIDVSMLNDGIYIVKVTKDNEIVDSKKLIIAR